MSNARRYLADARSQVRSQRGNYAHADGNFQNQNPYWNAGGPSMPTGPSPAPSQAPGGGMQAPTSRPKIIVVSNGSAGNISNFDILGAFQYLGQSTPGVWQANGNFVYQSVTISYNIPNVTYNMFLGQLQLNPEAIGTTYLKLDGGNAAQLTTPFTIYAGDSSGNISQSPVFPIILPWQYQGGNLVNNTPFNLDYFTKITISTLYANTVIEFWLFPISDVNPARIIAGQGSQMNYGNPGIGSNTVIVKQPLNRTLSGGSM